MLTIFKKKDTSLPVMQSWDPITDVRSLINRTPLRAMLNTGVEFNPAFEVKETRDGFHFTADVPGVKESDLEINLQGSRLMISGRRDRSQHQISDTVHTWERGYGTFQRAFNLPQGVDLSQARAELNEGVLTITLPRGDESPQRKISIS